MNDQISSQNNINASIAGASNDIIILRINQPAKAIELKPCQQSVKIQQRIEIQSYSKYNSINYKIYSLPMFWSFLVAFGRLLGGD